MKFLKSKYSVIVFILIVLYSVFNIAFILIEHDDLAVLRASSYLSNDKDQTLLKTILEDLEENRDELHTREYGRYIGRLTFYTSYRIQSYLIRVFERLPSFFLYQGVFLSGFGLVFISLSVFLFTLIKFHKNLFFPVWTVFFLSFVLKYIGMNEFLLNNITLKSPFQGYEFWMGLTSRNAVIMIFGANIFILISSMTNKKKAAYSLAFFGLAYLFHSSHSFLLYGSGVITYFVGGAIYKYIISKQKLLGLILLYNLGIVAVGVIYNFIIKMFLPTAVFDFNNIVLFWWGWSNLLLIYINKNKFEKPNKILYIFFFFFSMVVLGTISQTYLNDYLRWENLQSFYVIEASNRLLKPTTFLFWILVADTLFRNKNILSKTWRTMSIILGILSIFLITRATISAYPRRMPLRDEVESSVMITDLLELPGNMPYTSEILFFHSIANELKSKSDFP